MKIYRIWPSMDAPGVYPVGDQDQFAEEVLFKLGELEEDAEVGPFELAGARHAGASFYQLSSAVMVFSEQVFRSEMGELLRFSGNIHPTKLVDNGEDIFFLNVTAIYDCLNVAESTAGGRDEYGAIEKYTFFPELIGESRIFKIPQLRKGIFVRADGAGDDFHALYHAAGLKGVDFVEVWSDE